MALLRNLVVFTHESFRLYSIAMNIVTAAMNIVTAAMNIVTAVVLMTGIPGEGRSSEERV